MEPDERIRIWASPPEKIEPDDYSPGAPYAKEITWWPCETCGVDVHLPVTQFLMHGILCPRCGDLLLAPPVDRDDWLKRVMAEEDEMSEQL